MSGEYGEPWFTDNDKELYTDIQNPNQEAIKYVGDIDGWVDNAHLRIVACVNALDGLNPAALAEVLDAAEEAATEADGSGQARLRAALAKLHEAGS